MVWENITSSVSEFILLGLSSHPKTQVALFVIFFVIYLIILLGNSLIIVLTITDTSLQTPMYFFLTNLSFLDICYSSTTVPRMLKDLLSVKKTISFVDCAAQMYISLSLGVTECILLAIMSYDRYIAICYPLHYTTIMNRSGCMRIAVGTWVSGFFISILHVAFTLNLPLCGHNVINHFLCEVPGILSLGCTDTFINEIVIFTLGVIVLMIPVSFIFISYCRIIVILLKMTSSGRKKAFSTCVSHMMVVTLFYSTAMSMYMKPRSNYSPERDKMVAIFYTIITPMLNPLIYTLRNREVNSALKKVCIKNVFFFQM
ncbi:olfactory receptor 10A7-like [Ascaphus truei]|uniref:olfactory receptor 10A7-like n=1 Tax=Ascaphus truei TaxID=8439 RepID=UPI003F595DCC